MRTTALLVTIRDLLLAALALLIGGVLWSLPWNSARWLGRRGGAAAYRVWPAARRVAMINLRRAYGKEMTHARAAKWTQEVLRSMGESIAEGLQFARLLRSKRREWTRYVEVEDPVLADELLADERPKVLVTGHLGSWDAALSIAALQGAGDVVARRVDNPFLNRVLHWLRRGPDSKWIEKSGAVPRSLESLRAGRTVALLQDETAGPKGPYLPFFGRPASTRKTAALLSLTCRAPIVLAAVVRRGRDRPHLYKLARIEPNAFGQGSDAVLHLSKEINRVWEGWVREYPLQWRWIHWRWKHQPGRVEESYDRRELRRVFGLSSRSWASGRKEKRRFLLGGQE